MAIIIPGPRISTDWNPSTRDYEDRVFRWRLCVGLDDVTGLPVEIASYTLELTPDLGWPDPEAMFEPFVQGDVPSGNSKLIVIEGLSLASSLTDVGDETASYAVPLDTMKQLLTPGYERYLWRVTPVAVGGTVGTPSSIHKFQGRVVVPMTAWSIDSVERVTRSMTALLRGTKAVSVSQIEIAGSTGWTTFPSPTTWEAEIPLDPGTNTLALRAIDDRDYSSEYRTVELELTSKDLTVHSLWNAFDEFGFLLDLPRIPGENNYSYRERIKDVFVHRGSPRYSGLLNAINRELDLEYYDQAVLIGAFEHADSNLKIDGLRAWLTATAFYVTAPRMIKRQIRHEVDPNTLTVSVDDLRTFGDLIVESPSGVPVPDQHYALEDSVIRFRSAAYAGKAVYLTYQYVERVTLAGKTLAQFIAAVEALEYGGTQLLEAELGLDVSGSLSAEGLVRFRPTPIGDQVYLDASGTEVENRFPIRWSEARLYALMDQAFKLSLLNSHGSLFGTKYDGWAMRLKGLMRTTWGYLVADENVWSGRTTPVSGIGSLNTIYDAFRGHWVSGAGRTYSPWEAAEYDYVDPIDGDNLVYIGLPSWIFWSGVGDGLDLKVTFEEADDSTVDVELLPEATALPTSNDEAEDNDSLGVGVVDSSSEVS